MSLNNFLYHIKYVGAHRPDRVNPARWQGMLAWFQKNFKGDWDLFILNSINESLKS